MQLTRIKAVPRDSAGEFREAKIENKEESGMATIPQKSKTQSGIPPNTALPANQTEIKKNVKAR